MPRSMSKKTHAERVQRTQDNKQRAADKIAKRKAKKPRGCWVLPIFRKVMGINK